MTDLKKGEQRGSGETANMTQPSADRPEDAGDSRSIQGRTRSTEGTNRDFDETDQSRNQAHGHPREERS